MTTQQILSAAYAQVFEIEEKASGSYYGQQLDCGVVIDYTSFDLHSIDYDMDTSTIVAATADGSEGCFIDFNVRRYDRDLKRYTYTYVGCIKTLDEGRDAWRSMGALAGEMNYLCYDVIWNLYRQEESRKAADA